MKPQQGTVIAAGNGKANGHGKRVRLDVKPGDRILFGKYGGQEITIDGHEYFIMKEVDVLAIVEGRVKQTALFPAGPPRFSRREAVNHTDTRAS